MVVARANAIQEQSDVGVGSPTPSPSNWSKRYGDAYKLRRVREFPAGLRPPDRVRVYSRGPYFVLQFWEPSAKRNVNERIDGDLLDALTRARQIDTRLATVRQSGTGDRKLTCIDLIDRFLLDLSRRADAGQLAVSTVERYTSALAHFRAFVDEPSQRKLFRYAAGAGRELQLAFAANLEQLSAARRGHADAGQRPLGSPQQVLDAVRAMFAWAADPARGNLLPLEFRNPFRQVDYRRRCPVGDTFDQPDITTSMAVELLGACDAFQLPLFATLALFGLRASEPIFLFREQLDGEWLKVICQPALGYLTKGRRDKRFPLPPALHDLMLPSGCRREGLLFTHRGAELNPSGAPLFAASLAELAAEYERRCRLSSASSAAARQGIRDEIVRAAGGLNYDQIQHEFQRLARRLGWPPQATIKDLRHLFLTSLENSGVPEFYRRYLAGHAPGKAAIATYTHIDQLKIQFEKALGQDLAPLIAAVERRVEDLALSRTPAPH